MKRRAPEPDQELRHFYDGSAALVETRGLFLVNYLML